MIIGYARVSTQDQNPQLQLDALGAAGCEQVFHEKATGKLRERVELTACLRSMRKGDTLVVRSSTGLPGRSGSGRDHP